MRTWQAVMVLALSAPVYADGIKVSPAKTEQVAEEKVTLVIRMPPETKGGEGKLMKPQLVWAVRTERVDEKTKEVLTDWNIRGMVTDDPNKRTGISGDGSIGKGTTITDAAGNEYTSDKEHSKASILTKLTKKAEPKKEDKKEEKK